MNDASLPFGQVLRNKRLAAKISLRRFAEQLGVSATYLSQVEQCNTPPPTPERIQHMAELLGVNADLLMTLAGRVPDELAELIHRHPVELPRLIRALAEWSSEDIEALTDRIQSECG